MSRFMGGVRKPVKRADAERYLLLMLLSFAAAVVLTRIYLQMTGFPQVGGGELHIAHLLWGGLLLFSTVALLLTVANRWMQTLSAILGGIGVGLFIDEVGKFITRTNDYFYPAAAPIIYAFFLLTVMFYLEVRRRRSLTPRSELYHAFEHLTEVIDNDLDIQERSEIERRLQRVIQAQADYPHQARLANTLMDFLKSDDRYLVPHIPTYWERFVAFLQAFEQQHISRRRLKAILVIGMGLFGGASVLGMVPLLLAIVRPSYLSPISDELIKTGLIKSHNGFTWYVTGLALEGVIGLLLFVAAILFLAGHDRRGFAFGYLGLLLCLVTVNLLVLYFDQFTTIASTLAQFALLVGVLRYRQRFMTG